MGVREREPVKWQARAAIPQAEFEATLADIGVTYDQSSLSQPLRPIPHAQCEPPIPENPGASRTQLATLAGVTQLTITRPK
jgi:hypothetical protein